MANVKISNLTAASTPVAGTEVLPIVQSGATVKVSIANLTPGLSTITTAKGGTGLTSFTANGVVYASSTSALTTGSVLTFDGAILGVNGVSVGRGAGAVSTNTAVGASALAANTSGLANAAFGYNSQLNNTTGQSNTSIGNSALGVNTTGSYNTAIGNAALLLNTTASNNTAVGYQALYANTTGDNNTGIGWKSLIANTTGIANSAVGLNSLFSNTTGNYNVAFGQQALNSNTTASNNTAVGYQAGYSNTGADNLFLGYQAGYSNTTGTLNTYLGRWAGKNGTGDNNTYVGINTGYQSTGSRNTFVGARSTTESCAGSMTTGSANTILGAFSGNQGGLDIRTASNYIVLSDGDGNPRGIFDGSGNLLAGCTNTLNLTQSGNYLGNGTASYVGTGHANGTASGSNYTAYYYNAGYIGGITQNGTTAVAYNTTSDYRLKENVQPLSGALEKVAALKPCTYTWKSAPDEIGEGFIAHELAEVCPQAVTGAKDAVDEDGNPVYQGIDTSFLVATLVAAIQELKADLDATKAELAALKGQA